MDEECGEDSPTMSRKKGLLYDTDDGLSDPPVTDPVGTGPPRTLPAGLAYGTNSITVTVQQPGKTKPNGHFVTSLPAADNANIISPASSPSSEEEGPHCNRAESFKETPSGKSSRAASETRLLVPDDVINPPEACDITTQLVDPDSAGSITLWNGIKMKATEFIHKVSEDTVKGWFYSVLTLQTIHFLQNTHNRHTELALFVATGVFREVKVQFQFGVRFCGVMCIVVLLERVVTRLDCLTLEKMGPTLIPLDRRLNAHASRLRCLDKIRQ